MNPADLDGMAKADKDELLGIIETMQTRDRRAARRSWGAAAHVVAR
jgi:hypothetical protein